MSSLLKNLPYLSGGFMSVELRRDVLKRYDWKARSNKKYLT